jgi:hypothetical protein
MNRKKFSVGRWEMRWPNPDKWTSYSEFDKDQDALRCARRLYKSLYKRRYLPEVNVIERHFMDGKVVTVSRLNFIIHSDRRYYRDLNR